MKVKAEGWGKDGLKFPEVNSPVPGTRPTDHCDLIAPAGSEVKEQMCLAEPGVGGESLAARDRNLPWRICLVVRASHLVI